MEPHVWVVKEYDEIKTANLAQEAGLTPVTAALLVQRGCLELNQVRDFLCPSLDALTDPWQIAGMKEAVGVIREAVNHRTRVVIYGDYDVDGVCSTVILKEGLQKIGCEADYYIPDRFQEGYGLNQSAVEELAGMGYGLLISVDCGIRSLQEVERARELGMQVVITDHHIPGESLPAAEAVVNPKLGAPDAASELAGAGVVYQMVRALLDGEFTRDEALQWLDLTAMATVADVVPLRGDNRILVKKGLERLSQTTRQGLKHLLEDNKMQGGVISPWQVGFVLGPRLNSAGRLQHAKLSVELLMAQDIDQARYLATVLGKLNEERKNIEEIIYREAILRINNEPALLETGILVLDGNQWHHGVLGIVASRLCEQYHQPVILISWEGEIGRGSCRSVPGVDISAVLEACSGHLLRFGGHMMAAGLSIEQPRLSPFRQAVSEWIRGQAPGQMEPARQFIDLELDPDEIDEALYQEMQLLEPYGEGNPPPVLAVRSVELSGSAMVGKQKEHFKARLHHTGLDVIAFRKPEYNMFPSRECRADIAFHLDSNEFRGKKSLQLRVKRMKPAYQPDGGALAGGAVLEPSWVGRILAEINHDRPVLCVFPTYRTMIAGKRSLDQWLRATLLQEIHGRLPYTMRLTAEHGFNAGSTNVFLTTAAYLQYYARFHQLPERLEYIAHFYNEDPPPVMPPLTPNYDHFPIFRGFNAVQWNQVEWQDSSHDKPVIYANRARTILQWQQSHPVTFCEAGLMDWNARKQIRRAYDRSDVGLLITDGYASGWPLTAADGLFLADVPFSAAEMGQILGQIWIDSNQPLRILFGQSDVERNIAYLDRVYPDLTMVKAAIQALSSLRQEAVEDDIQILTNLVSARLGSPVTPTQLLSVLRILTDLGLCQSKKKGSIMAIKFMRHQKTTFHIAESPYYLEGLAEKKAYQEWANQLKLFLTW